MSGPAAWLERSYDQPDGLQGGWRYGDDSHTPAGLFQVVPDHPDAGCHCEETGGFNSDSAARWTGTEAI